MRKWRGFLIALPTLTAALCALAAFGIRYASDLLLWFTRLGGRTPGAAMETAADVLSGFHKGTIQPSIPAALLGAALALLPAAYAFCRGKSRAAGKVLASVCSLIPLLLAFAATLLLTRVNGIRLRDALRCLWPMRDSIGEPLL